MKTIITMPEWLRRKLQEVEKQKREAESSEKEKAEDKTDQAPFKGWVQ